MSYTTTHEWDEDKMSKEEEKAFFALKKHDLVAYSFATMFPHEKDLWDLQEHEANKIDPKN